MFSDEIYVIVDEFGNEVERVDDYDYAVEKCKKHCEIAPHSIYVEE